MINGIGFSQQALNLALQFGGKVEYVHYSANLDVNSFRTFLQVFSTTKALSIKQLPDDENFYFTAKINPKLTELAVFDPIPYAALLGVFKIFPNLKKVSISIKHLDISGSTQEDIDRLHARLKKLERFTVGLSHEKGVTNIKQLQNITDLYINLNCWPEDYSSLKDACKNLTFLSIENFAALGNGVDSIRSLAKVSNEKLDFDKVFESFSKLTTLQLDKNLFKPSVLRIIKAKGKNLKSLILWGTSKDFIRSLNAKARIVCIERLAITNIDGKSNFFFLNKGVFKLDYFNNFKR